MPISKLQSNRKFLAGMIFFLVFLGLFVFGGEKASATGVCGINCFSNNVEFPPPDNEEKEVADRDECDKYADQKSEEESNGITCYGQYWEGKTTKTLTSSERAFSTGAVSAGSSITCDFMNKPIVCLLEPILWLVKILFLAAGTFFGWVIKTDNLTQVLSGGAGSRGVVYEMWTYIRDILNVAFILILLFSAFCTIFQIDRYNYKKILLMLVIMALLVNFSYPIARFIIDVSNVMMYSLINNFFSFKGNESIFTTRLSGTAGLSELFNINTYQNSGMLLVSIIFLFMFTITLIAFAVLLFIRMIALAILIIFSPIGFVGYVMPGFQSFAGQWWDNLFKYSFFGPIMMLGLTICVKMMTAISSGSFKSMSDEMTKKADPNLIGIIAFLFLPIILLWLTMSIAQKMSIEGAGVVMGKAQGFLKGAGKWSGKNLTGYNLAKWGAKQTGVPGAMKQKWDEYKRSGFFGSERREMREDKWASRGFEKGPLSKVPGLNRISGGEDRAINKRSKQYKDKDIQADELKTKASLGDAAAVARLIEENELDDTVYGSFMSSRASTKEKDIIAKKTKKNRADLAFLHKAKEKIAEDKRAGRSYTATTEQAEIDRVIREEFRKLGTDKWADQNWGDIFKNPSLKPSNIADITISFNDLTDQARAEISKKLSADKVAALRAKGGAI